MQALAIIFASTSPVALSLEVSELGFRLGLMASASPFSQRRLVTGTVNTDKSKMYRKKYLMESVDKELLKKQMLEVLSERLFDI